ncbi:hypothetical protein PAXINDRAFT_101856 [Paxillus involutus ATCC 200175]|uniref:Protein kinase domain-containing protein n=1 Tax=Paxillus involutus ATCC 200175 TaxID=664439 RepID=A0A0C9T5C7_PAXIN|nr:hypothetical protein PAXINDRAFT_101856 [Paxillus involutus ATCC 200175]
MTAVDPDLELDGNEVLEGKVYDWKELEVVNKGTMPTGFVEDISVLDKAAGGQWNVKDLLSSEALPFCQMPFCHSAGRLNLKIILPTTLLVALHDAFELYGRPKSYTWDPRDPLSTMFAYPVGPGRDLLFLDRELAETMNPREDRTSATRSRLLNVVLEQMRGADPQLLDEAPAPPPLSLNTPPPSQQRPLHPPPSGQSDEQPPQLPQLSSLGFDVPAPQTQSPPQLADSAIGSALSPAAECSNTGETLTEFARVQGHQGDDPGPSVSPSLGPSAMVLPNPFVLLTSQIPVADDRNGRNSTALEESVQENAWDLDDIRSAFPTNLTGHVVRQGEHPFASGSYGDIYRGTFRVSGKSIDVAVKAIRTYSTDDVDDPEKEKTLRREIRVWLNLKHINILPLFGTTMGFGKFPAMVCPWLENGALTSYLERRGDTLTTMERLVLVGDVAMGLYYCENQYFSPGYSRSSEISYLTVHSRSVVHGDLSGSNVLIGANGRACIADFGLSTLLTAFGGSTFGSTSPAAGTLRWTAPELLYLNVEPSGDEENIPRVPPTPRSDIYSFGAIMLQVLTGKIPYHYYPREDRVWFALSQGEIPKRPSRTLVTDDQWSFMQWCWNPFDATHSRPSDDDIVEFTRNELARDLLP